MNAILLIATVVSLAGEALKDSFRIARLTPESWTPAFRALFGAPTEQIVPIKPDFNSYDR